MKIPNLNTISTLIDRLCIENVKKAHFEFLINQEKDNSPQLKEKIYVQNQLIETIKVELVLAFDEMFSLGKYEYFGEVRTFKQGNSSTDIGKKKENE